MVTKPLAACRKCGAPLELSAATGRPPSYCGETCKRLIEHEVRRIDRRLAAYELEQRELKFDGPDDFDDGPRQKRLRALRTWIQTDESRLRELLGGRSTKPAP